MVSNMENATIKCLQDQLTQSAERENLLEYKIKLNEEALGNERCVNENMQTRVEELKSELRIVTRQLQQYQSAQMNEIAERRRSAMMFYREMHERQQQATGYLNVQSTPHVGTQEAGEGYDVIDSGPKTVPLSGESLPQSADPEAMLLCPICNKGIPVSQHERFIEHAEGCM